MIEPTGLLPIVATPFTPDGEVDRESFINLLDTLAQWGADGLTLFGIAGEYYKLTDDERVWMTELLAARCKELGVLSVVSVTDHAAEVAAKRARQWIELGAESLMLLPPFFLKPGAAAVEHHIRAVAAAVPDTPIMVQYAPEQTGVAIPPATFARIANDLSNVRDFKIECKPPGRYITQLLELTDQPVRIHVGNAGYNMIEAFDRGAVGVMPGCSMTDVYRQVLDAHAVGDRPREIEIHAALLAVLNQIRQNVEMIIRFEKHILMRRGAIAHDICRSPTHEHDEFERELFDSLYPLIEAFFIASQTTTGANA